jgi:ankyrin repeat protein
MTFLLTFNAFDIYLMISGGNLEGVRELINNGIDINVSNDHGYTPLHSAVNQEKLEIIKLLIENGADINKSSNFYQTPLYTAVHKENLEIVKLLIDNGADINQYNNGGWTPLNIAANDGYFEIAKLLLENKADINKNNSNGWTPLNSAYGADINKENHYERSPLDSSIYNNFTDITILLLMHGAIISDYRKLLESDTDGSIYRFLTMIWEPKTHSQFPIETRKSISTIFKLHLKDCQISRLPKELLLLLCSFVAVKNIKFL